jgi:molybdopterin molybdotransferase
MSLLPVADAQARMLALASALPLETVAVVDAVGRYATADIRARRTQPAADLSAMDGYAIRFADLPGPWAVAGESAAGSAPGAAIGAGEAFRIFTGAPLPVGADTILIQEDAACEGERLAVSGDAPPAAGTFVRTAGSDFAAGDVLVPAGTAIRPATIGLAVAGGHGALDVCRRPRVAILSTGSELVPAGAPTSGAMLPASNGPMLQAMLSGLPVDVRDHGIVRDDLDAIAAAFAALAADADIIVTSGGASVGDHDLVRPALERAGAAIDFWRIAMRPGKPLMVGTLGKAVVLGLPGNPVSSFVTATLFLRPLVAHMLGAASSLPVTTPARLAVDLPPVGERADYLRARYHDGIVTPVHSQDSGALFALALADALIVRPARAAAARSGDMVEIVTLG